MLFRILLACVIALLCSVKLQAQWHTPIGALPTRYNGGFAGEAGEPRLSFFSFVESGPRNYVNNAHSIYTGSFISVDHFLKKIRSGVAFTVGQSITKNWGIDSRVTSLSLAISPKFSVKGKYTFAPFADFTFSHGDHEFDPTRYPDFYHSSNAFNLKTGFLLNSQKAYVGLSTNILGYYSRGSLYFFSNMAYYLQAGYRFQRTPESKFSFTPQLLISYHRPSFENPMTNQHETYNFISLADLNLTFRYKKFIAGLNNSGIMFGYQNNKFKLQVTNYYTDRISLNGRWELSDHTTAFTRILPNGPDTYTGNISLRYIFKKDPPAKMQNF